MEQARRQPRSSSTDSWTAATWALPAGDPEQEGKDGLVYLLQRMAQNQKLDMGIESQLVKLLTAREWRVACPQSVRSYKSVRAVYWEHPFLELFWMNA